MNGNLDIRYVKGVGEKRARLFNRLGVDNLDALIRLYPRKYIDLSAPVSIADAQPGRKCAVLARVGGAVEQKKYRTNLTVYRFTVTDGKSEMDITLFNTKYIAERLKFGENYLFYGTVTENFLGKQMASPEIYPSDRREYIPVYPAVNGLSSKTIEKIIINALNSYAIDDYLPEPIKSAYKFPDYKTALNNIHHPPDSAALAAARRRLAYDELFVFQLSLLLHTATLDKTTNVRITSDKSAEFAARLPFTLTESQNRVIGECIGDMRSGKRLHRLVQGDVGSGKTAVAASLAYTVIKNGYQAAVMAPTEILAEQHFATFSRFFEGTGIAVALLTGSTPAKEKKAVKAELRSGKIHLLIGTHAVIMPDVLFDSLGLVVTDEQHRFGVEQRSRLSEKGDSPHTLVLSATPIPRTLGMILYGDLDISVIDTLPAGRQPVSTYVVDTSYHRRIYAFIKKNIDSGRQAYIVCPAVEDSEDENLISAENYYNELSKGVFADYGIGLLHGKMKPKDKTSVMRRFLNGEIKILVATTVIEIGVDVPNATVMVVENAERFGLAQLHQLRGRIGRGSEKSYCILVSDGKSEESVNRLRILKNTDNGFEISDADLKLRGPGDFLGKRQHGLPLFRLADLYTDLNMLKASARDAKKLLKLNPGLTDYPELLEICRRNIHDSTGE